MRDVLYGLRVLMKNCGSEKFHVGGPLLPPTTQPRQPKSKQEGIAKNRTNEGRIVRFASFNEKLRWEKISCFEPFLGFEFFLGSVRVGFGWGSVGFGFGSGWVRVRFERGRVLVRFGFGSVRVRFGLGRVWGRFVFGYAGVRFGLGQVWVRFGLIFV